jgi:hypothetical protein
METKDATKNESKLSDFATPIRAKNNFIKASFGGFAGSGKSRTASEFIIGAYKDLGCSKPILFIDNEKGSRFLIPLFNEAGIETLVKDTIELPDVIKAFEYLQKGEISFLFIDSLTKIWYKYTRDYKIINKRTFMTLQDWGKLLPAWQEEFSDRFVSLDGNCVFTGRGGYTYDMEENEETHKKEFTKSGVKMKMAGETPFEPDINVWMDINQKIEDDKPVVWREAMILKDRSALIDGKTFKNPTYKNFQPVVNYLMNTPKGSVAGASDTTNLAPKENFQALENRTQMEIELDKIKSLFDKYGFGTSKEDKMNKVKITEIVFHTVSGAEVEKMKVEDIRKGRQHLEELLVKFNQSTDKNKFLEEYKPDLFNT